MSRTKAGTPVTPIDCAWAVLVRTRSAKPPSPSRRQRRPRRDQPRLPPREALLGRRCCGLPPSRRASTGRGWDGEVPDRVPARLGRVRGSYSALHPAAGCRRGRRPRTSASGAHGMRRRSVREVVRAVFRPAGTRDAGRRAAMSPQRRTGARATRPWAGRGGRTVRCSRTRSRRAGFPCVLGSYHCSGFRSGRPRVRAPRSTRPLCGSSGVSGMLLPGKQRVTRRLAQRPCASCQARLQ